MRGDGNMGNKIKDKKSDNTPYDELFNLCIEKGLIEKTEHGYYFRTEFFETCEIYEE